MTSSSVHDRPNDPCDDYVSLLVRAADGHLDASGRARLDAHLPTCEACRAALDAQRMAHVILADAFDIAPPPGFATRVVARVEPHEGWLDRLDFRRWTWRVSPVTAGLFLAAWLVAAGSETTSASASVAVVNATDAGVEADAVLWSDAVDGADLVTLAWDAEVAAASSAVALEENPQ